MMMDLQDYLLLVERPAAIVDRQGVLLCVNSGFQKLMPQLGAGQTLSSATVDDAAVETVLLRAARTNAPLPCALKFNTNSEPLKLTGRCHRLVPPEGPAVFALTFNTQASARFKALSDHIEQLNAEIARRQQVQQNLEDALNRNQLLLREIHHRVGNNLQIQMSLLDQQSRFAGNDEFRSLTARANDRLWALSQSLTFMYENGDWSRLPAEQLFGAVLNNLSKRFGKDVNLRFDAQFEWSVPNDMANTCALLLNELVINAYEHGLNRRPGEIWVTLAHHGREVVLDVRDPGEGFADDETSKGFGLMLVGRLCKLIGARFETENDQGGVARLIFKDELAGATHDAA